MKKIVIALLTTISGVVLLFSYRTSTEAVLPTSDPAPVDQTSAPPVPSGQVSAPTTPAAASSGLLDGSYQGVSTSTRWGPVQVQITVSGGSVTDVQAIDYPHQNGEDLQINSYAIPRLTTEALAAQSAQIDMVSGATVTSRGYIASLQSALDQAKG